MKMKNLMFTFRLILAFLLILLGKTYKIIILFILWFTCWICFDSFTIILLQILDILGSLAHKILLVLSTVSIAIFFYGIDQLKTLIEDEEYVKKENKVRSRNSKSKEKLLESKLHKLSLLKRILDEMIAEGILAHVGKEKTVCAWEIQTFDFKLLDYSDIKVLLAFFKSLKKSG